MRQIQMGKGGMINPAADEQCGAIDASVTLPEPVHIGGCSGCRKEIHTILLKRYGMFKEKTNKRVRRER